MNRILHDADETNNNDGNKYKYEKVKNGKWDRDR